MAIEEIPLRRDDIDRRPPGLIGGDVDRVLAGLGAPPAPVLTRIVEHWVDLVGPAMAEHCHPGGLVDGRLHVEVDGAAWASQLRWQERALLASLIELIPDVRVEALAVKVRPNG